ncbi:hypothetical protein [Nonomuraea bangladeshensis]|uniref:hypothetical protein n=1 Tax=Nonomuraea bangladeshensis TaxID=404385 RepID=UPI003C308BE5
MAISGQPPVRLHDLRHGAATLALAAHTDLKVVHAMLDHAGIVPTTDTYDLQLVGGGECPPLGRSASRSDSFVLASLACLRATAASSRSISVDAWITVLIRSVLLDQELHQ